MRRALFLRELRTALMPNLVTVGVILTAFIALGEFVRKDQDVRATIDFGLLVVLVLSGFISGERCFPPELKESRMLFLSSLPISRTGTWLGIVSARLLSGLITLTPMAVLQLSWFSGRQPPYIPFFALLLLLGYILLFSVGALFALLFRRPLFAYIAGLWIFGALLGETLLSCSYATEIPSLASVHIAGHWDGPPHPSALAFLSLFLVSSFVLSWRFFVEGEIGNVKRRVRNHLLFGITAVAYLGIVFCVTSSKRLSVVGGTWNLAPMLADRGHYGSQSASQDGRYLAVFEALDDRPFISRVSLIDVRTGRMTGQSLVSGIYRAYWSGVGRGAVLNLIVINNSPLDRWGYLRPATADWIRMSPEGEAISNHRLPGAQRIEVLEGGRALAVEEKDSVGKGLILDGTRGASSLVLQAPLDGDASIQTDGSAALVYFSNTLVPSRAWVIGSTAQELHISRSPSTISLVLFGEMAGSLAEAQALLLKKFSPPVGPGGTPASGEFILLDYYFWAVGSVSEIKGLYFLEKSDAVAWSLWARSTAPEGRWERLSDIAPELLLLFANPARAPELYIDFASGMGSFPTKARTRGVLFYDPQLGISHEEGGCPPGSKALPSVSRVTGLEGILITLACRDSSSSQTATRYFEHRLGMPVRPIKTAVLGSNADLVYLDEEGTAVWEGSDGKIWSSAPGRQDLRLWSGKRLPLD